MFLIRKLLLLSFFFYNVYPTKGTFAVSTCNFLVFHYFLVSRPHSGIIGHKECFSYLLAGFQVVRDCFISLAGFKLI